MNTLGFILCFYLLKGIIITLEPCVISCSNGIAQFLKRHNKEVQNLIGTLERNQWSIFIVYFKLQICESLDMFLSKNAFN